LIVFAEEALGDLERILDLNVERDAASALDHIARIRSAVLILDEHPEIGRPIGGGLRQLVISHGRTGYLALYEHAAAAGLIRIVAVRHQREAGYRGR
jgi:plasmid stabilization system protein ParE